MSHRIGDKLVKSHTDVLRGRRCYRYVRTRQLYARPVADLPACEFP